MKFIIVILAIITLAPTIVLALEVDFPAFGGIKPQNTFGPAQWINYIFVFALGVVGLALIYTFTRAGIEWMLAGENSGKVTAARKRIQSGIVGLLILLGSYIILNTINPDLVNFRNPDVSFYIQGDPYKGLITSGTPCTSNNVCREKRNGQCQGTKGQIIDASSKEIGKCYYPPTASFAPQSRKTGDICDKDLDCQSGHCRAAPSSPGLFCSIF